MHRSWGNAIPADEAFERMGADAMRWQFCEQNPSQNIRFGYGPANEVKRRLLTLWHSASFLIDYANIEEFRPRWDDLGTVPANAELRPLDRWLLARTQALVARCEAGYAEYETPRIAYEVESFVDDLSNWYIRRSRSRFWGGDETALRTLWVALAQVLRVMAPLLPFLSDHLWRNLVADACKGAPDSVHLAGWPEVVEELVDDELLAEMAEVRRVVALGHQARAHSGIKLRQPLRRLVVQGADGISGHAHELGDELNVKDVEFGPVEATELRVKPNLPILGPKLGKELGPVRSALEAGEFEELDGGRLRVNGHELAPEEVLVERRGKEGWAVAGEDGLTVALDLALDPELELEGRARELIHRVNGMRKEAGLELTDRIVLTLPEAESDLLGHAERIKEETLAVRIETDDAEAPSIARA
jgi:isoleucyl-tRNA synthetase